jgi:hypothetical protein
VSGGTGDPDGEEERYALAGDESWAREVFKFTRREAASLDRALRRAIPGGPLIVRAVGGVRWPIVCADLCMPYAACLGARVAEADSAAWKGPAQRGPEFERWRAELALLAPVGFDPVPGVRYVDGYRQARVATGVLARALGRVPGWWVIEPDCWADGTGVVRLMTTPEDSSRLTVALS